MYEHKYKSYMTIYVLFISSLSRSILAPNEANRKGRKYFLMVFLCD